MLIWAMEGGGDGGGAVERVEGGFRRLALWCCFYEYLPTYLVPIERRSGSSEEHYPPPSIATSQARPGQAKQDR